MSDKLTANRAPFGQKPAAVGSDALMVVVAALAGPDKPPAPEATASTAVAPTPRRASRRLNWEEWFAGLVIGSLLLLPAI
jgi:hypothetical protein